MDDIFEPKFHKAWNEALIKENKLPRSFAINFGMAAAWEMFEIRLKWFEDQANQEKGKEDLSDEDFDTDSNLPCTYKNNESRSKLLQKIDWPRKGAVGTSTIIRVTDTRSDMRQPSSAMKNKLYEGTGHDGNGRADYLRRRCKEGPTEKFRSRVCTSWDYGWHYGTGENELSCICPPHQCNIKQQAFDNP